MVRMRVMCMGCERSSRFGGCSQWASPTKACSCDTFPLLAGGLKATLRDLPASSSVSETVRDLQALDARLALIDTMPKLLYGTARMGSTGSLVDLGATRGSLSGSPAGTQSSPVLSSTGRPRMPHPMAGVMPDYGSPPLSSTQRRLAKVKATEPYKRRRAKLEPISSRDIELRVMSKEATPDTLFALCMLASW